MKISGFVFLPNTRLHVLLQTKWSHGSPFGADQKFKTGPQSFPHGSEGTGQWTVTIFSYEHCCLVLMEAWYIATQDGRRQQKSCIPLSWACWRPFRKFKSVHAICDASCKALLHLAWGGLESSGGISSMFKGLTANILSQSSVVKDAFVRGGVFDRFRRSAASCSFPFIGVSVVPFAAEFPPFCLTFPDPCLTWLASLLGLVGLVDLVGLIHWVGWPHSLGWTHSLDP